MHAEVAGPLGVMGGVNITVGVAIERGGGRRRRRAAARRRRNLQGCVMSKCMDKVGVCLADAACSPVAMKLMNTPISDLDPSLLDTIPPLQGIADCTCVQSVAGYWLQGSFRPGFYM